MPDEYKQTQRIEYLHGNATYNYHHHEAPPPRPPFRRWGLVGGITAALALGGTLVATQLSAKTVYYCASHNSDVKYHTDATCRWLQQCGARVKSLPLSKARAHMDACKACH